MILIYITLSIHYLKAQQDHFSTFDLESIQFRHLTADQGLAHNRVHTAIMDDQGYMWFGTQDGLSRWDGSSIKTYYPDSGDSTAISGSLVTDIAKDKEGYLWIVSHQGDLCRYDPQKDEFKTFHYPEFEDGVVITSEMEVMIGSDGIIWIGCFDDGFIKFDPDKETFKRYDIVQDLKRDDDRVRKNSALIIVEDPHDPKTLWLGTNFGLYSFNKTTEVVTWHPANGQVGGNGAVRGIYKQDTDHIWLTTLSSGLVKHNLRKDSWEYFVPNQKMWDEQNFSFNYIHDFEKKSENEFWISSAENGSGLFNMDTKEFQFFKKSSSSSTSISSETGFKVYTDPTGRVWWMHINGGVSYMDPSCQIFSFNSFELPGNEASWNRFLADFAFGNSEKVIYGVGHVRDGLFEIDLETEEYSRIPTLGFEQRMRQYDAILKTNGGEIIVGGFHNSYPISGQYLDSPLQILDQRNRVLKPYRPEIFKDIQNKNINDLIEDSADNLWIATDDGFLYKFNQESEQLNEYYLETVHGTGMNMIVESKKQQKLYLATFDGIYSFDLINKNFELIEGTMEFSSRGICLSEEEDLLWIGTRQLGVQCFDIQNQKLLPIAEYRNSPRTPVEKVFSDSHGDIWATTERGLYLLNEESNSFYDFSVNSGIEQDYFYSQGIHTLKDGNIILGQQGGYYTFDPEVLRESIKPNPVVITDVFVNQREVKKEFGDDNQYSFDLEYDENSISISFASVSYCLQDKAEFTYRLDGLEDDWIIPLDRGRTINYPSLASGDYTFLVKQLGVSDDQIASVSVRINPPFWRSWLAYILYAGLFAYAINWIYGVKLRRQKEKEDLRIKISSDIHDDVGSLLAGLAMQSETMALGKPDEEKASLLDISGKSREAIERLRDIVWVLDARRDKYENLIDRMKHFADSKFRSTNYNYTFTSEGLPLQKFISPDVRQSFYLVFKEAVTNLLKHSNGNIAKIYFAKEGGDLVLRIYDNGTNNQISKSEGLGLSNMKMRANKINASLNIENKDGFAVEMRTKE